MRRAKLSPSCDSCCVHASFFHLPLADKPRILRAEFSLLSEMPQNSTDTRVLVCGHRGNFAPDFPFVRK